MFHVPGKKTPLSRKKKTTPPPVFLNQFKPKTHVGTILPDKGQKI